MSGEDEGVPTQDEIRDQLKHMLAGRRFTANEKPSLFLSLVVDMKLRGELITQSIIGLELYRDKYTRDEISDVRVLAIAVRKVIADYYAHEGENDPVLIELPAPPGKGAPKLPPGKAYAPVFSYNPHSEAVKQYKLGGYYLARGMFEDYVRALEHFARANKVAPGHIGAAIGAAESLCGLLGYAVFEMDNAEINRHFDDAARILDTVYDRALNLWRYNAAVGLLLYLAGREPRAEVYFARALELDRSATQSYPPYFRFLADSGRKEEAVRLSTRNLDRHVGELAAHLAHARLLLHVGSLDEAEKILSDALHMDKNAYEAHLYFVFLRRRQNRPQEAEAHLKQVEALADPDTFKQMKRYFQRTLRSA
jgi:tetratricopeptide (TPR) repeat protein